jgi:hypothetical protein
MEKPLRVKKQKLNSVICTSAAICNFLQQKDACSDESLRMFVRETIEKQFLHKKKEVIQEEINLAMGHAGVAPEFGRKYMKEKFGINLFSVDRKDFKKVKDGIITGTASFSKGGYKFGHTLCIRNGYIIDSIESTPEPYLFTGKILGYYFFDIEYMYSPLKELAQKPSYIEIDD